MGGHHSTCSSSGYSTENWSYDQNTHILTYSFEEFTETKKDGQRIDHSSSSKTITYNLNDIEPWPGHYYGKVALVENYTFTETPLIHVPTKVQDIQSYVTAECIRMLQESNNMDISHQLMLFLTRLGKGALSLGHKIHDEISQTLRVVYILYNMETTTTEGMNGNGDTDAEAEYTQSALPEGATSFGSSSQQICIKTEKCDNGQNTPGQDSEQYSSEDEISDITTPQEIKDEIKAIMEVIYKIDGSTMNVSGINRQWLLAVQTRVLILHSIENFLDLDDQVVMESLSQIGTNLSDKEFFKLTQSLCYLYSQPPERIEPPPSLLNVSSNTSSKFLWCLLFASLQLQQSITKSIPLGEFFVTKSREKDNEQILAKAIATSQLLPQDVQTLHNCIIESDIPSKYKDLWLKLYNSSTTDLPLSIHSMIKELSKHLFHFEVSPCSLHCLQELLHNKIMVDDEEFRELLVDTVSTSLWYPTQIFTFLQDIKLSLEERKESLNFIMSHRLPWFAIQDACKSSDFITNLKTFSEKSSEKELNNLILEIAESELLDDAMLAKTKEIVRCALEKKQNGISDKEQCCDYVKKVLKQAQHQVNTEENLGLVVTVLCNTIQEINGSYPTNAQMVALSILLLFAIQVDEQIKVSQILEVLPGEGTPCIISMIAAALALLGKKVDIVANFPSEAEDNYCKWTNFYKTFDICIGCNISTLMPDFEKNNIRPPCYECPIVYGTISSFAVDFLMDQFEFESIRGSRRCEALLISEVSKPMMHDTLQFTQRAHSAPFLKHVEPVLALVWTITNCYTSLQTSFTEERLYAGPQGYFHSIIMQCVNQLKDPTQILLSAVKNEIITEGTLKTIRDGDLEKQKEAMERIDTQGIIDLFVFFGEKFHIQFYLYTMNESGLLQHETNTSRQKTQFSILVDGGMCSFLYTHDKLIEGVKQQVIDSIRTSDEQTRMEMMVEDVSNIVSRYFCRSATLKSTFENMLQRNGNSLDQKDCAEIAREAINGMVGDIHMKGLIKTTRKACQNQRELPQESKKIVNSLLEKYETCLTQYCNEHQVNTDDLDDFTKSASNAFMNLIKHALLQNTVEIPSFVQPYILDQLCNIISCAIKAVEMMPDRDYVVCNGNVFPVDYQNSGAIEFDRKLEGTLQQMLQIKHKLVITPLTVVTNFMSNVEFFKKYNLLFGFIETADFTSDPYIVQSLCKGSICKIPSFKQTKLYEREPLIVNGSKDDWFEQVCKSLDYEVNRKSLKNPRAALVLCEDIYTAKELHKFIQKKHGEWNIKLINSQTVERQACEIKTGDIIVSTNAASYLTDVHVSHSVNESGGLFCILTFLPTNQSVEMRGFLKAGQKGNPGSVQLIIPSFSLPSEWQQLDMFEVRRLRDKQHFVLVRTLIENSIPQIKLREKLFFTYCKFIDSAYTNEMRNSINEKWGMWLQSQKIVSQIQNLESEKLQDQLSEAYKQWSHEGPNLYYYTFTRLGNSFLETEVETAATNYTKAINSDAQNAVAAYYNRAYCTCVSKRDNYLKDSIRDLRKARKAMSHLVDSFSCLLCACTNPNQQGKKSTDLKIQIQARLQILASLGDNISRACEMLQKLKDNGSDADVMSDYFLNLVPNSDDITKLELNGLMCLGFQTIFTVEKHDVKKKKSSQGFWSGFAVLVLGALEVVGGACLTAFSAGTASSIGMYLISEGISDSIDGSIGMCTGKFDWKQWGIAKATNLLICIATGGIGSFFKGPAILIEGISEAAEVAECGWRAALKSSFKATVKSIAKEASIQISLRTLSFLEEEAFQEFAKQVGIELSHSVKPSIEKSFAEGTLGATAEQLIISNPQPPSKEKHVHYYSNLCNKFFYSLAHKIFYSISHQSEVQEDLKSLFLQFSERVENRTVKAVSDIIAVLDVSKTIAKLAIFQESFVPGIEKECMKQLSSLEHSSSTFDSNTEMYAQILTTHLTKTFATLTERLIVDGLGVIIMHKANVGFNSLVANKLGKVLNVEQTMREIKAGENANRIAHGRIVTEKKEINVNDVSSHANSVLNEHTPGTILELRAYAEHSNTRIIIVNENGKTLRSIAPSGKADKTVTLKYTEPDEARYPNGHYDPVVDGVVKKVSNSEDSSCMFESIAIGSGGMQNAQSIRNEVADQLKSNPAKWHDFVKRRYEVVEVSKGKSILMTGAGGQIKQNKGTKLVNKSVVRTITTDGKGKTVENGKYRQRNGVELEYERYYDKQLKLGHVTPGGSVNITSPEWSVNMLKINVEGLKFSGKGRCLHTRASEGSIQLHGTPPYEQPVSFHVIPSEAGVNAGWNFGSSVTTSPQYNRKELTLRKEQKTFTEGKSFSCKAVVEFEPLDAILSRKRLPIKQKEQLMKRFEEVRKKDPSAKRVKTITWTFTNHKGETLIQKMESDGDLYMPRLHNKSNSDVQKGKARRKIYRIKNVKKDQKNR